MVRLPDAAGGHVCVEHDSGSGPLRGSLDLMLPTMVRPSGIGVSEGRPLDSRPGKSRVRAVVDE